VITEPLPQLAAAVEHELSRQRAEYLRYGMELDTAATVDEEAGTVVITGKSLRIWGPRARLEGMLTEAGLRWQAYQPDMRIVVYPTSA
jgi:hypothetical protein